MLLMVDASKQFMWTADTPKAQIARCKILNFIDQMRLSTFKSSHPRMGEPLSTLGEANFILHDEVYDDLAIAICIDIRTARPRESERFPPSYVYLVVLPRNKAWAYDVRVEVEIPVLYDLHGTMKCPSWYFLSCALKSQLDEYHTYGWDMRVNDEFWKLSRS
jgi:hypothetical protein